MRKKGRNLCRVWSCGEKAIGFGRARLVWENGVQMMWIVSMCAVCYNKEADKVSRRGLRCKCDRKGMYSSAIVLEKP